MKRKAGLWLFVAASVWLVGCGVPPSYDVHEQAQSVTVSPSGSWRGEVDLAKTGTFGKPLPTSKTTVSLDPGAFPKGPLPLPVIPINVFGQKTFDMKQHTQRFNIAVNYPNLHVCGLKFTTTSQRAWTASQWKSLLGEFQISPHHPTTWGSGPYDLPRPTMKVVATSGGHHAEINFTGPQFYVVWLQLQTRSGLTWRDAVQKIGGQGAQATFQMESIMCPGRRP